MESMNAVDHLVFACADLTSGIEQVADLLGVMPILGGRHSSWGTRNAMLSLGDSVYLEIIAPDPEVIDGFERPTVFVGSEIGSLTTWAAALDDLPSKHARAANAGHHFGAVLEGSRVNESGVMLEWSLTDPMIRLMEGVVPFLIDWGLSPHPSRSAPQGCRLRALTLFHPNPHLVSAILVDTGIDLGDMVKVRAGRDSGITAVIETPRGEIEIQG